MSLHRNTLVLLTVAAIAATSVTPSFASKNDHRFAESSEAFKKRINEQYCDGLKDNLVINEAEADKRAGTKAAEKYSKAADAMWKAGESAGCSWAQ
jgi:hypothetical protein